MERESATWKWLDRNYFRGDIKRSAAVIWLLGVVHLATVVTLIYIALLKFDAEESTQMSYLLAAGLAGVLSFAFLGIAATLLLRYLYRKPLSLVDDLFRELAEGRLDLSADIEPLPYPELQHVHRGYNRFMQQIRELIEHIRAMGVRIAIDSTSVRKIIEDTNQKTNRQKELSEMVSLASTDANTAIGELSKNVQYVADNTTTNLEGAKQSLTELVDVARKVAQINRTVDTFRDTVASLNRNSASIMDIISLINNISEETNLLSLNATIEAARAGEHGKGFAVVAEEVRTLAKRVKPATEDIAEKVNRMVENVDKTMAETEAIMQSSSEVGSTIDQTSANFESMTNDLEGTNDQLLKIAAAIEELTTNNAEIHGKVSNIDRLGHEIDTDMASSAQSMRRLNDVTETMQELVSHYKTGQGVLDRVIDDVRRHRDAIQSQIAAMHEQGVNVFDGNHRPIPDTKPQKYTTAYTQAFKKELQSYIDDTLKKIPGAIYTLPISQNGYLPAHHAHVSRPLTGDYDSDLLYSRDQRIYFSNQTEERRATSTAPMLLQTYMRDTGEILNDLSMPIMINGRHWGAFIVGLNPESILKE